MAMGHSRDLVTPSRLQAQSSHHDWEIPQSNHPVAQSRNLVTAPLGQTGCGHELERGARGFFGAVHQTICVGVHQAQISVLTDGPRQRQAAVGLVYAQDGADQSRRFPLAQRVGCSTAGEISVHGVENRSAAVTALHFERSSFQVVSTELASMETSFEAGEALALPLSNWAPKAVLVLGQGLNINGSAMIDGMVKHLGAALPIAGGLAGDDGAFQKTYTLSNEGISCTRLVAVGFKGDGLQFAHGSFGGWKPFGPVRKVTRSVNNVLYELDGEPALEVYQRYLGDYAKDLPGSGLLFPFEMLSHAREPACQLVCQCRCRKMCRTREHQQQLRRDRLQRAQLRKVSRKMLQHHLFDTHFLIP